MLLKKKEKELPAKKIVLMLPGALVQGLEEYRSLYKDVHKEEIEQKDALIEMLKGYLELDKDFQKQKGKKNGHGVGAIQSLE